MTIITKGNNRKLPFNIPRLVSFVKDISSKFPHLNINDFINKTIRSIEGKEEVSANQITNEMMLNSLELIGVNEGQHPDWTKIAAQLHLKKLYKEASYNRSYNSNDKYGNFFGLIKTLTQKGLYSPSILEKYTKEEIDELGNIIDSEKDDLFTYIAIHTLSERYLTKDHDGNVYELPQERYLIIAMYLMQNESKEKRMELVKEAYWAMSNHYMTVATPTLSNSGKSYGQLSSCFIDSVEDSLDGIYASNWDTARLSKDGGGIAAYFGNVRAESSPIKGFKGRSGGITNWLRQLNNTAVSVDQLGQRQGAIAAYLDVFHKDIFNFLDGRSNNGDERKKFHDLFTGVCIPDLFMEKVRNREDWYLFCPYEVEKEMGFKLQDFYDEERGKGTFRNKYQECIDNQNLNKKRVSAIEVMKGIMKSQLESGTPYMFYRDQVNRLDVNKRFRDDGTGITTIYCSNLCTEITQPVSSTTIKKEILMDDGTIITYKQSGEFVVCNLSSISLAKAVKDDVLERLIPIQVRMLDNVIDLNKISVLQARYTNERYRAIGLGTFGLAHLFAINKIKWESDEAVEFVDKLYEKIAFLTIRSSMELAKEKNPYPLFKGSEWESGEYFELRNYNSPEWTELKREVQKNGIRNSYLMAVAPNISTSILCGSTASIDPIFKRVYSEEKKDYKIPVVVPELSNENIWYYKNGYEIDQHWSIKQNAARQKHVDQSISFNFYVKNDIKASALLDLHLHAWEIGLKTTYYVRSTGVGDFKDCESCSS